MNIKQLQSAGFRFETFGFHSLAVQCTRCSGERAIIVKTREPSEDDLREVVRLIGERHKCTHGNVS